MAASPKYKCYDDRNQYVASVKDLTLAGAIMAVLGEYSTVRTGHTKADIIYTEGTNGDSAESNHAVASWVIDQEEIR